MQGSGPNMFFGDLLMGEWLKPVPVKLPEWAVKELKALGDAQPFPVGVSTVGRGIILRFLHLMACGIVTFAAEDGNRAQSISRAHGIPADSQELPGPQGPGAKPPVRALVGGKDTRRGRVSGISRREAVANEAWGTSFPLHFTPSRRVA